MSGTVRLVCIENITGDYHHVVTSPDELTDEEICEYLHSKGCAGKIRVFENNQYVHKIPAKTVADVVDVKHRLSGEVICSGANVRDAISKAIGWDTALCGADLSGADLSDMDLAGADFYAAKLVGVDFSRSDVTRVNFRDADMGGAIFDRAIGFRVPNTGLGGE